MRKIFLFVAAMLVALVANAAVINIDATTANSIQAALNSAATGDEIVMAAGTYNESGNYLAFTGKELTLRAAEGADVTIKTVCPVRLKEGAKAEFINVKFDCSTIGDYEYVIVAADDTENKRVVLTGCEFYGWAKNKAMIEATSARRLAAITIDKCYFHDCMKSVVFIENTGSINLSITNSTFANVSTDTESFWAGVIDSRATAGSVLVDHCTFYNVQAMNTDYAAVGKCATPGAIVSNSIFMQPTAVDGVRAIRDVAQANNCITYNYLKDNGTGIHSSVTQTNCVQADPLFVDAANGNFKLGEGSPALTMNDGAPIGDPRWNATAPVVTPQYEVAEAIAAGLTDDDEIMVRGIITKMEFKGANFAKYGSVNIYVADATGVEGEFEFFNCYSLNADTFRTSIPNYDPTDKTWAQFNEVADENGNTIHVGDTVIAFGKYKLYNSTHELNTGCYLVDIKHAPVAPADTITIDIESEVQYTDYVAQAGWWQFMAENDEYEISISNVSTTQAAGTYTVADLDADYTYVFIKADSTDVHFVDGEFTLTEGEDGSRTIEGVMTGDDGNIYNIKLVFRIPAPETTVNVEIPEWGIADASQYYGFAGYIFYGETADKSIYVQLVIPGSNPLGTFTYDDCYAGGTGIEVGGDYKSIYSMNITINASDAQRAIITMDILCFNNTLYHVTTTIGEGINNVDAAVKAIKRLVNGTVVIEKGGKKYNVNGARL